MNLLNRNFNLDQTIVFTGAADPGDDPNAAYIVLDNSWSSFDIPNTNSNGRWLIVLDFDNFWYQSSSPSDMGIDIRFVIDGKSTRAYRIIHGKNIVHHYENLLPVGSHGLAIEVRGVFRHVGPPGPVRIFGIGSLLVQAKPARTYGKEICVCTADGGLWHSIDYADYSWQPGFGNVKAVVGDPGKFISVSCCMGKDDIGVDQALHVFGITEEGGLWYTARKTDDGSWIPFGDIKAISGNPGIFKAASCAIVHRELHVCCIAEDGGLWHNKRGEDGVWQTQFGDVKGQSGNPGKFIAIKCCEDDGDELFVCGVTEDGGAWHTLRRLDGSWLPQFVDLKLEAGDPGKFMSISCAEFNGINELVALTTDGNIWSTTRSSNGWGQFKDLRASVASPGNFTAIDCTYAYGDFCLYGVASNRDIWRSEYMRILSSEWGQFENVKKQSANPDNVTSIGCASIPPMID